MCVKFIDILSVLRKKYRNRNKNWPKLLFTNFHPLMFLFKVACSAKIYLLAGTTALVGTIFQNLESFAKYKSSKHRISIPKGVKITPTSELQPLFLSHKLFFHHFLSITQLNMEKCFHQKYSSTSRSSLTLHMKL